MPHSHDHASSTSNLKLAFFLNLGFTVLEFIGGAYVNSVAIVSDAVHDLGDSLSLGTAWYLQNKSKQKANNRFSFGYRRFSLLGALINGLVLLLGSAYVVYEAIQRLMHPEETDAQGMVVFALLGVAVNGYAAWKLSKGKSLNERMVSWHLLEDVLGWVAILIVSIILYFKDWYFLDPALSLLITFYILYNTYKRLRETLYLFLQGVPTEIDIDEIESKIKRIGHVHSLHHTHIWSEEGEHHVLTTHVKLKDIQYLNQIVAAKENIKAILIDYDFSHYTIETELDEETCALDGASHP